MVKVYVLTSEYYDHDIEHLIGVYTTMDAAKTAAVISSGAEDLEWSHHSPLTEFMPNEYVAYDDESMYTIKECSLNQNPKPPVMREDDDDEDEDE